MEPAACFIVGLLLLVIVMPILAMIWASNARQSIKFLERDLKKLKRRVAYLEGNKEAGAPLSPAPSTSGEESGAVAVAPEPSEEEVASPGEELVQPPAVLPEEIPEGSAEEVVGPLPPSSPSPSPSSSQSRATARQARPPKKAAFVFDEKMGPRIAIWVGAIALALAGAFLVHYSWKQGWFSEGMRVISGLVMGGLLIGAGFWVRKQSANVGRALTAAGVADIFTCIWAATSVYHLISRELGFCGLVAATALAIVLSLRQGQLVLIIGMIGGFITPLLVRSEVPHPEVLFPYLLLLAAGILMVTRMRKWYLPAMATLPLGYAWVIGYLGQPFAREHAVWLGFFILASAQIHYLAARPGRDGPAWGREMARIFLNWMGVVGGVLLLAAVVNVAGYATLPLILFFVMALGAMLLERHEEGFPFLAWPGMLVTLSLLGNPPAQLLAQEGRLVLFILGAGLLFGGGAYYLLWGAGQPVRFAALSSASVTSLFLVAYGQLHEQVTGNVWWLVAGGLGLLLTIGAIPLYRRRGQMPGAENALAALVTGAVLAACFAVPIALDRIWLTFGWGIGVALLAAIDYRFRIPVLRVLISLFSGLVAFRLLLNPMIYHYDAPARPIFNWILFGYGVPAISMFIGARIFRRLAVRRLATWLFANGQALLLALVTLQIRHLFHGGQLFQGDLGLAEWGTYTSAWILFGLYMVVADRWRPDRVLRFGGLAVAGIGLFVAFLAQGLGVNPALRPYPVGSIPVFNLLLLVYGVPGILGLFLARECGRLKFTVARLVTSIATLALFLLLITYEVRQAFHGSMLANVNLGLAEWGTCTSAWILFGLGMMVADRWWPDRVLRFGGLAVAGIGLFVAFLAQGLGVNPALHPYPVGSMPVFNLILLVFGVPGVLGIFLVRECGRLKFNVVRLITGIATLVLFFLLITYEVRQAFHGTVLANVNIGNAEHYANSAAWGLFGTVLLVLGILRRGKFLRFAALAVMALTVGKVFIYDTAHLKELYRVLSFLGLGITLLLLAFLYHRFVFHDETVGEVAGEEAETDGDSGEDGGS